MRTSVLAPDAWKAVFVRGVRDRLPMLGDDDLLSLADAVWDCVSQMAPEMAADITCRFIEEN